MLVISPYLGLPTPEDPANAGPPKVPGWFRAIYETAIERGYTIVQVSFRGTGASGGCEDFGGPGEQGDVRAAVDWASHQPWSDGRVGMIGHSYEGFAGIMAMGQRLPVAAAVLLSPVADPYRGAYMNGVPYAAGRVIGWYYQSFALIPPLNGGAAATALPTRDPRCSAGIIAQSQSNDPGSPFWRERNFIARASGSDVPVLWVHGFLDGHDDYSSVRPSQFVDA
jgi:putative CocE/NonD family hydrolase